MIELLPLANHVAELLKQRNHTVAVAESSTGGLVSALLLTVPGASSYFLGGAVIYTVEARRAIFEITDEKMAGMRASTEPYAMLMARTARERLGAVWGLGETGATGPTGNRYGDPPGHTCIAISGPVERVITLATGSHDRVGNMRAFSAGALDLLAQSLASS
jgi:nicotinamide-nucleotide amidase